MSKKTEIAVFDSYWVAVIVLLFTFSSFSQYKVLSNHAEISIITIAQGKNLFDTFGHSAIRVNDKNNNFDRVYNYGVYDFNTPNFYIKFMRGQLLYNLETTTMYAFLRHYTRENREIKEQVLELTQIEKQNYFEFLENNAAPENKKYLYDFFYDNCATKLLDVTIKVLQEKVVYKDELNNNFTFRDLIHQKLDTHYWGKFVIDIALGSVIDKKTSLKEASFLPSYVFKNFESAKVLKGDRKLSLVKQTNYLFKPFVKKTEALKFKFTPMLFFVLLAIAIIFVTIKDSKNKKHTKWLDFILLFMTGFIGVIIFLLWFATDHSTTINNFNIFWAFTPNLIVAFYIFKNKKFIKIYYLLLLLLLVITVLFWLLKVQVFNLALIPILIALAVRYIFLWKTLNIKSEIKLN
ncbi:MAG: DUF4105 domain-containing protein [Flavobacteriaceae bacterium]|nr:DUF4105 domain-containing protein [Flavobacteriaceae bacterium]